MHASAAKDLYQYLEAELHGAPLFYHDGALLPQNLLIIHRGSTQKNSQPHCAN